MKALLARLPRDRAMFLLLAPPLVLLAVLVAGRAEPEYSAMPVGVEAPTTTTTEPAPRDEVVAEVAAAESEVAGTTVSRSGTTTGSGRASSGGTNTPSRLSEWTGEPAPEVAGQTTLPDTAEDPAATTTTQPETPTTTVPEEPGPEPAVNESPLPVLLPISALLFVGVVGGLLLRRRRRAIDAHSSSSPSSPPARR
jgi:MYXO-CTERM domain-containing protein